LKDILFYKTPMNLQLDARIIRRSIKKGLGVNLKKGDIEIVPIPESFVEKAISIQQIFKVKTVFFRLENDITDHTGIYGTAIDFTIYININDNLEYLKTAGHEIWHIIERQYPKLKIMLLQMLSGNIQIDAYNKYIEDNYVDFDGTVKFNNILVCNELLADLIGELISDESTLNDLECNSFAHVIEIKHSNKNHPVEETVVQKCFYNFEIAKKVAKEILKIYINL